MLSEPVVNMKTIVMVSKLITTLIYCLLHHYHFLHFICMFGILQRSTFNETKVVWTKDEAKSFCINYMNESAGYKACLGVPNVTPENAIADCVADIQVPVSFFRFRKILM